MWDYFLDWHNSIFDSLNALEVNLPNSVFRLIMGMLLGMVVGAERKRKGQTAGIRTFALISMGACLAMLLSIYVPQEYMGLKNGDPGRIAAQVITGIGFLGGGAMIQMRGTVKGLTTAAGIWMTAIIGMAVGVGMYVIAISATILILIILVLIEQYEKHRKIGQESKVICITVDGILEDITPYRELFKRESVHLSTFLIEFDYGKQETTMNFVILAHAYTDLIQLLNTVGTIMPTKKLILSNQLDI